MGGLCKHIVATVLDCIHEPESVRELPALEDVLSGLEREELEDLLLKLPQRDPSLTEIIEAEVAQHAAIARNREQGNRLR